MWRPFRARAPIKNERTLSQLSGRGAFIETETSVVLLSGGGGSSRKEGGCWNDEDEEEGVNGSGVRVEAAGGLFLVGALLGISDEVSTCMQECF